MANFAEAGDKSGDPVWWLEDQARALRASAHGFSEQSRLALERVAAATLHAERFEAAAARLRAGAPEVVTTEQPEPASVAWPSRPMAPEERPEEWPAQELRALVPVDEGAPHSADTERPSA